MSDLGQILELFILSMLPLWEGRYTAVLVLTKVVTIDVHIAYLTIIFATFLLALVLVLVMKYVDSFFTWCNSTNSRLLKFLGRLYTRYVLNLRKRAKPYVDRYGILALSVFVAVPIPATGVWSGAVIAYLFGFDKAKAFIALSIGGLMSIAITSMVAMIFGIVLD